MPPQPQDERESGCSNIPATCILQVRPTSCGAWWSAGGLVVLAGVDVQVSKDLAGGGVHDGDVEVLDEQDDVGSGVGSADADVAELAGDAQGDAAGFVDLVVADPVVGVSASVLVRGGLGQRGVDGRRGGAVGQGPVGPVGVVDLDELIEQGLQLGEGGGLSGLGAEPLLEGLNQRSRTHRGREPATWNLHAAEPQRAVTWYDDGADIVWLFAVTNHDDKGIVRCSKSGTLWPTAADRADLEPFKAEQGRIPREVAGLRDASVLRESAESDQSRWTALDDQHLARFLKDSPQ